MGLVIASTVDLPPLVAALLFGLGQVDMVMRACPCGRNGGSCKTPQVM